MFDVRQLERDISVGRIIAGENVWPKPITFHILPRPENQLLLLLEGGRDYYQKGEFLFTAGPGDLIFMPTGSAYDTPQRTPGTCRGLAVLFDLKDGTGENVILGDRPKMLLHDTANYYHDVMRKIQEQVFKGGFAGLRCKELLYRVLYRISQEESLYGSDVSKAVIFKIGQYLKDHLTESICMEEVARQFYISKSTFYRQFQKHFHTTPNVFHTQLRIQTCEELLSSGLYSVTQVAQIMGFSDVSNFSKTFLAVTGTYPSSVMKRQAIATDTKNAGGMV